MPKSDFKDMLDAVFGAPPPGTIHIVISELRLKQLVSGKTLQFKAGKQVVQIEKEK